MEEANGEIVIGAGNGLVGDLAVYKAEVVR